MQAAASAAAAVPVVMKNSRQVREGDEGAGADKDGRKTGHHPGKPPSAAERKANVEHDGENACCNK